MRGQELGEEIIHIFFSMIKYIGITLLYLLWAIFFGILISGIIMVIKFI